VPGSRPPLCSPGFEPRGMFATFCYFFDPTFDIPNESTSNLCYFLLLSNESRSITFEPPQKNPPGMLSGCGMRALPITRCSTLRSALTRSRCASVSAPDLATGGDPGGCLAGSVGGTGRNHDGGPFCGPVHEPSTLASIVVGGLGSSGPGRGPPR